MNNVTSFGLFHSNERRRMIRRLRRIALFKGTKKERKFLKDRNNAELVLSEMFAQFYSQDVEPTEIGDGKILDQILRFLNWVLDNWDKIGPIIGMIDYE